MCVWTLSPRLWTEVLFANEGLLALDFGLWTLDFGLLMHRTAVINVVGLTESLIGPAMPRISAFRQSGAVAKIAPAFPAVTCTAQSTYLTGTAPAEHGIVGNGWYH